MTFPPESEIQRAILQVLLSVGGHATPREVVAAVTQMFGDRLTDADMSATRKDGTSLWQNHVHWARLHLAQDGFIDRSTPGTWALTDAGAQRARASLGESPPPTDTRTVAEDPPHVSDPNDVAMSMLTALLHEVSNSELPWSVDYLDDGSVTLSYNRRLRVILRPQSE